MKLVYLARLREVFGKSGEDIAAPAGVTTVAGLIDWLRQRGEPFSVELGAGKRFRVAVNQQVATPDMPVKQGDEIAFFPPVTGG